MAKPRKYYWWSDSSGRVELKLHIDDARIGYHPGQCDDDVMFLMRNRKYISRQLVDVNIDHARQYLTQDVGIEDVPSKGDDEVLMYIVWIACGDVIEEQRSYD